MQEDKKTNKCESLGFTHAWEDVTPSIVYLTDPPQYPPKTERCKNCGLERRLIIKHEEHWEYSEKQGDD